MNKVIAGVAAAGALAISLGISAVPASAGGNDKVQICHATGSTTNPYESIEVSVKAFEEAGHNGTGVKGHTGDIYPSYTYEDKDGESVTIPASPTWTTIVAGGLTGQEIWTAVPGEKGACEVPVEEEPEPTETVTPTPTDTETATPDPTDTETATPVPTKPSDDVADTGAGLTSTALIWGGGFLGLGLIAVAGASVMNTRRKH